MNKKLKVGYLEAIEELAAAIEHITPKQAEKRGVVRKALEYAATLMEADIRNRKE